MTTCNENRAPPEEAGEVNLARVRGAVVQVMDVEVAGTDSSGQQAAEDQGGCGEIMSLCAGTFASIAVFTRRSDPRMRIVVGAPRPAGVEDRDDLIRPPFANRSATRPTASNAAVEITAAVVNEVIVAPAKIDRRLQPVERARPPPRGDHQ